MFSYHLCSIDDNLKQRSANFFLKGKIVNILALCVVSVSTTVLCYCTVKATLDNTYIDEHGYVPIKLYIQTQVGSSLYSLSTPVLKELKTK